MLNIFTGVGRIANDIEIKEKNGRKYADIILSINRSYKNEDGIYECDLIPCRFYNDLAINIKEYCKKCDIIGVKGRIETRENKLCLLVEKVTFLTAKKNEEE